MGSLQSIPQIVERYGHDRHRLLDIIRDVHADRGYLADEDVEAIAKALDIHKIEIHDTATFYHFFSRDPRGRTTVRLCKAVIEKQHGMAAVAQAFEKAVGCRFGETSADGSDQPAVHLLHRDERSASVGSDQRQRRDGHQACGCPRDRREHPRRATGSLAAGWKRT